MSGDDEAVLGLLDRLAVVLGVDPAVFREQPRAIPIDGATAPPLDAELESILKQVPDRHVQARLKELIWTLDHQARRS